MKSIYKAGSVLFGTLLIGLFSFSQVKTNQSFIKSKKEGAMDTIASKNKEVIRNLYENILNKRKFEQLGSVISNDYANDQGGKGIEGFQKQIPELIKAFPDAQWTLTAIIAEGDNVVVKQTMQGTHREKFQNITPTNRAVTNEGMAIYKLKDGKIIHHEIKTDRLGFLQQLGVIPVDLTTLTTIKENEVYFIDRFLIPAGSMKEFTERMNYNRNFIKNLDGFIEDKAFEQKGDDGNFIVITTATWKSKEHLADAKTEVQSEYKRINFDPAEFYQRLHIQMERGIYSPYQQ